MAASGSVYRRVRKRPGKKDAVTWEARWRDDQGVQRRKTFEKRSEAEQFLTRRKHELNSGTYVSPEAGKITLQEFAEEWRAAQVYRPTTRAQQETHLRRHVYPHLGGRPLADLRPSEVQAWVKRLSETLAPSTVQVVYRVVTAIYSAAVQDRRVAVSPCKGTKLPEVESKRIKPLPTDAVAALIDAVPDRYRALLILAAGTGMRQGECFGLTVDRIDFMRQRTVTIDRQLINLPGKTPYLDKPKTKASNRTVPLPKAVLDALVAHLAAYPAGPDGFVFTNDAGEPIRRNRFSDSVWRHAVRTVGASVQGETFHSLRHYYASLLIRHGESVKTVQARLGHASAAETLDTYSHLWPDSDDRTREAVDAAWSGALVATSWPRLTMAD